MNHLEWFFMSSSSSSYGDNQGPNRNMLEVQVEDRLDGSSYHTWKF